MTLKLHNFIKTRRSELGMSQRDLAAKVKVSHTAISKLEGGGVTPSTETLNKLAKALGVPIGNLLELIDGKQFTQKEDPQTLILMDQIEKLSSSNRQILLGLIKVMLDVQSAE
jgi:transcriptional regulator with XRE-family HTH domain